MVEIKNAEGSTLKDFNLVVESLDKTTGEAAFKEIGNFIEEMVKGVEKRLKTDEMLFADEKYPGVKFGLGLRFGEWAFKNSP